MQFGKGRTNEYGEMVEDVGGFRVFASFAGTTDKVGYYFQGYNGAKTASLRLCEWARHLHGNPPSGTKYGSYRIILPNKRTASIPLYI